MNLIINDSIIMSYIATFVRLFTIFASIVLIIMFP